MDKLGEFHIISRELRISCLPGDIPNVIRIDVSGLDLGNSIHAGDVTLPEGASAVTDAAVALATVSAPKKEKEEVGKKSRRVPKRPDEYSRESLARVIPSTPCLKNFLPTDKKLVTATEAGLPTGHETALNTACPKTH